ncbi:MAG: flagellar hook-basal body complex protein [Pseudomonadota bacterium]
MGISSSLNASVAGLNVNTSKLSAISDNIANSGTNGYKRATVDFSSVVINQSSGSFDAGGVRATSGREVDERGALITSSNSTDIAIAGRGLLPVTPVTRRDDDPNIRPLQMVSTGSFTPDEDGFLTTASGLQLLGWPTDASGAVAGVIRGSGASLEPVQISGFDFASNPTQNINLGLNLPVDATDAGATTGAFDTGIEYFDELGRSQQLTLTFTPDTTGPGTSNTWQLTITDSATPAGPVGAWDITFHATGANSGYIDSIAATTPAPAGLVAGTAYNATTGLMTVPVAGVDITMNVGPEDAIGPLTQFASAFAPLGVTKDGTPVGGLNRVEVNADGYIEAIYDTGFRQTIYQIPVVDVPNPNGLNAVDNQAFEVSPASGPIYLWDAGTGPVGEMLGFALEQSATDIAKELTTLIETQRAYSSNATVVRTVDEMLQETTNLKR